MCEGQYLSSLCTHLFVVCFTQKLILNELRLIRFIFVVVNNTYLEICMLYLFMILGCHAAPDQLLLKLVINAMTNVSLCVCADISHIVILQIVKQNI
jgi:hypothetical protein